MPAVRSRIRAWLWLAILGTLVTATCLTVAVYASAWLVAPYLVVIVLILGIPQPLRRQARALAGRLRRGATGDRPTRRGHRPEVPSGTSGTIARPEPNPDVIALAPAAAMASEGGPDDPGMPVLDAAGPKPRRTRARARKMRSSPAVEPTSPTEATWVRVGPGKFVRVEPGVAFPGEPEATGTTPATETDPDLDRELEEPEVSAEPEASTRGEAPALDPDPQALDQAKELDGDNGNAPDAPETSNSSEPTGETDSQASFVVVATTSEVRTEPAPEPAVERVRYPYVSSQVMTEETAADGVSVDGSAHRHRPLAEHIAVRRGRGVPSPRAATAASADVRWNERGRRASFAGFRGHARVRRNLRHSGRFHHAERTYPPRSPPAVTR